MNRHPSSSAPSVTAPSPMPAGVWPVMLTPFTGDLRIDWPAYDELIDWYLASGVSGLFSVCLSGELYTLSDVERLDLARRAVSRVRGRVPVIAAGAFGPDLLAAGDFARKLAGAGVDAVVFLTNQFCPASGGDAEWRRGVETLLASLEHESASLPLGIYECPLPHARHLSPETLGWLASTRRFILTKDTCCDLSSIERKIAASRSASADFRFYNADSRTLLASLQAGGHGYSGIAANFYPHLFSWMCARHQSCVGDVGRLDAFFRDTAAVIHHKYMQCAKHYLRRAGLSIGPRTRLDEHTFSDDDLSALDALRIRVDEWGSRLGLANPAAILS